MIRWKYFVPQRYQLPKSILAGLALEYFGRIHRVRREEREHKRARERGRERERHVHNRQAHANDLIVVPLFFWVGKRLVRKTDFHEDAVRALALRTLLTLFAIVTLVWMVLERELWRERGRGRAEGKGREENGVETERACAQAGAREREMRDRKRERKRERERGREKARQR